MEAKVEAGQVDAFYQRQADEVRRIQGSLEGAMPLVQGIQAALIDAPKYIDELRGKDLVLVLGVTGAGKSVLINYLKGCDFTLETDAETGRDFVRPIPGHENRLYAKPGETPDSQTYYPQAFAIDADAKEERTTYYCDCPGHADTNQDGKAPASRLLIHQAIKESSSIRGVIMCVPFSSHDTRERDLRDMLVILDGLFRDATKLDVPMIFVATKAGGKNTQQFLNNLAIFRASQEKILPAKREQRASPAEIAILEQQIHLLNLITADNTLVVDPTKKGEASREAFRQKLGVMLRSTQSLAGIDKSAFYISPDHGDQQSLMQLIRRIAENGVQLSDSSKMLAAHVDQQSAVYFTNVDKIIAQKKLIRGYEDDIKQRAELSHDLNALKQAEKNQEAERNRRKVQEEIEREAWERANEKARRADRGACGGMTYLADFSPSFGWGRDSGAICGIIGLDGSIRSIGALEQQIKEIDAKKPDQELGVERSKLQALQKAQREIRDDVAQCQKQLAVNEGVFRTSSQIFQFAREMGGLAGIQDKNFQIFKQISQEKNLSHMREYNFDVPDSPRVASPVPAGTGKALARMGVTGANRSSAFEEVITSQVFGGRDAAF